MPKKKPYILTKTVGALTKYVKMDNRDAFRHATKVLQGLGLLRPGTQDLTRWGKLLEKRLKISRGLKISRVRRLK